MYLFQDSEKLNLSFKCKLCLEDLIYTLTLDEYKQITQFPFRIEIEHGSPAHILVVYLTKSLEIDKFEIEESAKEEKSYTKDLTNQILGEIGLNPEEIELYFKVTGRDAVSIGELAILIGKTKEECKEIAQKFVDKGLFKEIVGAIPHYAALPPYAALTKQLKDFNKYISDVKEIAPKQLEESFVELESKTEGIKSINEYASFMNDLKSDALKQMFTQKKNFDATVNGIDDIKAVSDNVINLQKQAKEIMDLQLKDLKERFGTINKQVYDSMVKQIENIKDEFQDLGTKFSQLFRQQLERMTTDLENIKNKISSNLAKLRLGVIQETVDSVIETVFEANLKSISSDIRNQLEQVKKLLNDQFKSTTNNFKDQLQEIQKATKEGLTKTEISFNVQFMKKLNTSIENTLANVNTVTDSAAQSGDQIKSIFADISKSFSVAVLEAEEKLSGISDSIFDSFGQLRETFSTKVVDVLNDELNKILERLQISEITTKEFWDQAKTTSLFTMKDIWFIRSREGAQAHISEQISKTKMRLLIVAPEISDIDFVALQSVPSHVNIRIAANINMSYEDHQMVIQELDKMHNVTYRHRELQNLWGINRDYEEVILCVTSERKTEDELFTEIAGLGSIIQEHIKIFVPILEDAWMGARKGLTHSLRPSKIEKKTASSAPSSFKESSTAQSTSFIETSGAKQAPPEPTPKPEKESVVPQTQLPSTSQMSAPSPQFASQDSAPSSKDELIKQYDALMNNLSSKNKIQLAQELDKLQFNINDIMGYSTVLKQIQMSVSQIKTSPTVDVDQLQKKMSFWRKKLGF